jgi:hypothetical protein
MTPSRDRTGNAARTFEPFAIARFEAHVTGQMVRFEEIIPQEDADHDLAEEHFIMADGNGNMSLACPYESCARDRNEREE